MIGPTLARDARVLVRMPSWLGDLVQALPSVRALVQHVGASNVSLAGDERLLALIQDELEGVRLIPHAGRSGERALDWRDHEVAVLFTGSFRSAWTAYRAGIPRRVGWSRDARGWLLTDPIRPALEGGGVPFGLGRVRRRSLVNRLARPYGATCVELVGLIGVSVGDTRPSLRVTDDERANARARLAALNLDAHAPFAVANVGARPGSTKGFPSASWALALDAFAAESGLPIALTAGPGEEASVAEVVAAVRTARTLPITAPPADLRELAALFAAARVVLATDSGPRHLAAAVGAPVAVVTGPTDPRHTADHLEQQALVRRELACSPCHREACALSGADHHACMRGIDPEELARVALGLMEYHAPLVQ